MGNYFLYVFTIFFNCLSPLFIFAQGLETKENKKIRIAVISACTVLIYVACSLVYYFFPNGIVYGIIFATVTLIDFSIFQILFKGKFLNLMFVFISSLYIFVFTAGLREALYCFLTPLDAIAPFIEKNSLSENVIQYVITIAVNIALFFLLRKRKNIFKNLEIEHWTLIIYGISWIIMPLIFAVSFFSGRSFTVGILHLAQACIALMVVYFQYFVIFFERNKSMLKESQRELQLIEHEQVQIYKRYEQEKQNYQFISAKCHDLKKQINILRRSRENLNESTLDEIDNSLSTFETSAKTGNASLDILIAEKAVTCKNLKIDFACMIDGNSFKFLELIDLYAIFGNAIDNAIEYLSTVEVSKRYLRIRQSIQGNILLLCFENYIENAIDTSSTSKENKTEHGFGIKSISYSVEKYGGTLNINQNEKCFSVEILFPKN